MFALFICFHYFLHLFTLFICLLCLFYLLICLWTAQLFFSEIFRCWSDDSSLCNVNAACNRTYDGVEGRIVSPRWPDLYRSTDICQFSIETPANTTISLYFGTFRIPNSNNCSTSALEVQFNAEHSAAINTVPVKSINAGWSVRHNSVPTRLRLYIETEDFIRHFPSKRDGGAQHGTLPYKWIFFFNLIKCLTFHSITARANENRTCYFL